MPLETRSFVPQTVVVTVTPFTMISVFTVGAAKLCAVVILIVILAEGAIVSKAFCKLVVIVASSVLDILYVTAAT